MLPTPNKNDPKNDLILEVLSMISGGTRIFIRNDIVSCIAEARSELLHEPNLSADARSVLEQQCSLGELALAYVDTADQEIRDLNKK